MQEQTLQLLNDSIENIQTKIKVKYLPPPKETTEGILRKLIKREGSGTKIIDMIRGIEPLAIQRKIQKEGDPSTNATIIEKMRNKVETPYTQPPLQSVSTTPAPKIEIARSKSTAPTGKYAAVRLAGEAISEIRKATEKATEKDRFEDSITRLAQIPGIKQKVIEIQKRDTPVEQDIEEMEKVLESNPISESDKEDLFTYIRSLTESPKGGKVQRKPTTFKKWKNSRRPNGKRSNTRLRRRSSRYSNSSGARTGRRTSSRMRSRRSTRF